MMPMHSSITSTKLPTFNKKNTTKLLEDILMSAKALTYADGGTVYSVNDSLNLHMGGTSDRPINFDCIPFILKDKQIKTH